MLFSVCATLLLLLNVVLLSYCHLAKKQRKRLERRERNNHDTDSENKEISIKKKINLNCVTSDTSESSRSCSTNSTSSSSSSSSSGSEETSKTPIDVIKPGSSSSQDMSPNNTEGKVVSQLLDRGDGDLGSFNQIWYGLMVVEKPFCMISNSEDIWAFIVKFII